MKNIYIAPVVEEIVLKNQFSLMAGSLLNNDDQAIVDLGGGPVEEIIDTGGVLDPDAREFDFEDDYEFE